VQLEVQEVVIVEGEPSLERLAAKHPWEPVAIVGPHPVEGDLRDGDPERSRFVGLPRLSAAVAGAEHVHEEREAVRELEPKLTARFDAQRRDAQLLLHLAHRAGKRGFPFLEMAARPVDLACAEAALLVDEEHLPVAHDEQERRPPLRFPRRPVDI